MIVEIDKHSGFCFGVKKAIETAIDLLDKDEQVYCVGDIVHNEEEAQRLNQLGMSIIEQSDIQKITSGTILFRAHGEAPLSYEQVKAKGLPLKDATCPVVLKLQQRIKKAYFNQKKQNGQIVIYGKRGHAEVVGLLGQTNGEAIVIEDVSEIGLIDYSLPIEVFAQTTKSPDSLKEIINHIQQKAKGSIRWHNTTCKQVTGRVPRIKEFAKKFDVVVFVGGHKSSNAKVLFDACKQVNSNSFFVSSKQELDGKWFSEGVKSVGICGATSTPNWLMESVAQLIKTDF